MEFDKLVKYLEENKFEKNAEPKTSLERFNCMLDKLEGKTPAEFIYSKKLKSKRKDNCGDKFNLEAILTVNIYPDKDKINATFHCFYPNFVWEEDEEVYEEINSSDEDEIIAFAKQFTYKKFKGEIVTDEMMNTILFTNGKRRSKEELEENRLGRLENYEDDEIEDEDEDELNEWFLKDCGFNSMEEYREYLKTLE